MQLNQGDRVKLTPEYATMLQMRTHHVSIHYAGRTGTVVDVRSAFVYQDEGGVNDEGGMFETQKAQVKWDGDPFAGDDGIWTYKSNDLEVQS